MAVVANHILTGRPSGGKATSHVSPKSHRWARRSLGVLFWAARKADTEPEGRTAACAYFATSPPISWGRENGEDLGGVRAGL
jgi:hypothetical protein